MPHRVLVRREVAGFLAVLEHPHRIGIIEELRDAECDVGSLQGSSGISHSGISQHLMVVRAHRIVCERRQGRHVDYRLRQPGLASWLPEATEFLGHDSVAVELREAIRRTRRAWAAR